MGLLCYFLFFSNSKTQKKVFKKTSKDLPEITLRETELYLFGKSNVKDCQILASESKMFTKLNKTECSDITCKLTTQKNITTILKAPKAFIDHEKKQMRLPGAVTGSFIQNKNIAGHQIWNLEKKDVFYDAIEKIITAKQMSIKSDKNISIFAPDSKIDLKNEIITLQNGVVSSFEKVKK